MLDRFTNENDDRFPSVSKDDRDLRNAICRFQCQIGHTSFYHGNQTSEHVSNTLVY